MPRAFICGVCGGISPTATHPECRRPKSTTKAHYRTAAWKRLAQKVRERDGDCVLADGTCSGRLVAHHLDPVALGGDVLPAMSRLVTLCTAHNSRVDADLKAGRSTAETRLLDLL